MAPSKSADQNLKPPSNRNSKAKSNNSRAQKGTAKSQEEEILTLEKVGCPVCMDSVMIEPVTLPCSHRLCHSCYKSCIEKSNLTCPNCRKYIGGFSRKTAKGNKAVDTALWEKLQVQFSQEIKLQEETKIGNDVETYVPLEVIHRQFAEPGELKKELEEQLTEQARLEEERRLKEETASASILAELEKEQAEEMAREAERERIRIEDEALALELSRQDNPIAAFNPSPSTVHTPPSTRKRPRNASDSLNTPAAKKISAFFQNRSVTNGNRESSGSSDFASTSRTPHPRSDSLTSGGRSSSASIDDEILPPKVLFRPIKSAPLTPPKQQTDGVKPQVVAGSSRNLDFLSEVEEPIADDENHNNTSMTNNEPVPKGGLWAELLKAEFERQKKQEEADRELARQLQKELDAERPHLVVNRSKGSQDQYLLRANRKVTDKKQSTIEDSFQRPSRRSTSPQP